MKTIYSLVVLFFLALGLQSCREQIQQQDNDTVATVYDLKNVNFALNNNRYTINRTFNTPIYSSDNILIYRQIGTTNNGSPIWQQIPRTLFLSNNRELDYDFDFSKFDFQIYAGGNYDVSTTPEYLNNQTFRIVIVPGAFGKNAVDTSDFDAVIRYYNIDLSKIKSL